MADLADDRIDTAPGRGRGRPRHGSIDTAVNRAVWELLDEMGYEALTFEAVAERANCSRPALYRRWKNKHALVLDILKRLMADTAAARPVRSGKGFEAVHGWLMGLLDFLSGPGRGALLALSHARRRDAQLATALDEIMAVDREKFFAELRPMVGAIPEARLGRLVDTLLGAIFFRVSLQDKPMDEDELRLLIAEQIAPLQLLPS